MSSALAIASVGLLAAAVRLRSRLARGAGSRSVKNVGALSNADIEGQILSGVDPGEVGLVWSAYGYYVYTLEDLEKSNSVQGDVSREDYARYVSILVREADAFFNSIRFPLRLYRGLVLKRPIDPRIGIYWSVDPGVALRFALADHEGSNQVLNQRDKPVAVSMVLSDPGQVDWPQTIENFFSFTAGHGVDRGIIERQIVLRQHQDTREIGKDIQIRRLPRR
jgi:hypothetical protein